MTCTVIKVTVFGGRKSGTTYAVSHGETVNQFLKNIGEIPEMRIVYINGKILSRTKMDEPFTQERVFLTVKHRVVRV